MSRIRMLAGLASLTLPMAAYAQSARNQSVSDIAPATSSLGAIAAVKSLLRDLVTAQEKYWYEHGRYSADVSALGLQAASRDEPAAHVLAAGGSGWTALAAHPGLKGKACMVYVGNGAELATGLPPVTAAKHKGAVEGVPRCDEP